MVKKQGDGIVTPRIGLGYVPSQSVKVFGQCKEKQSLAQYISMEEAENDNGGNATSNSEPLVFDRLQPSTSQQHPSIFSRMGKNKTATPFVSRRLKGGKQPKPSLFTRIKTGGKSSSSSLVQDGNFVFSPMGDVNEVKASFLHA